MNAITILLAEDDPGHRTLLKRNFRRLGLTNEIREFVDGQEILDYLRGCADSGNGLELSSALLLLDIRMPKVDGITILREVKSHPWLRRLPVVILSTSADPRDIDLCYDLGCNSYLCKPIETTQFVSLVRNLGYFLSIIRPPDLTSKPLENPHS